MKHSFSSSGAGFGRVIQSCPDMDSVLELHNLSLRIHMLGIMIESRSNDKKFLLSKTKRA